MNDVSVEIPLNVNLVWVAEFCSMSLTHEQMMQFILLLDSYMASYEFTTELKAKLEQIIADEDAAA